VADMEFSIDVSFFTRKNAHSHKVLEGKVLARVHPIQINL
jgi:hypothetical protein